MAELTENERRLLEFTTEQYWSVVYPPEIPRAFDVSRGGCPVCGNGILRFGRFPWLFDRNQPFKVKCPSCGSVFPDNDFEAFWKSGFKDKSLLKGRYVDDGWGWEPEPGKPKYWFVAFYVHHRLWKEWEPLKLAEAFSRTGNVEFARRSAAMLDHYADFYRFYDHNKQSRTAKEVLPKYTGRYLNMIWETFLVSNFADAYQAILPFLAADDEELMRVTGKNSAAIRKNIEENMFQVMADDITSLNGRISGNFGMHQCALLKASEILHKPELARWVTDFAVRPGDNNMPLDYAVFNNLFGDGTPAEAPIYNEHWLEKIENICALLKKNGVDEFAKFPNLKRILSYPAKLLMCGKFSQSCGDSGYMDALYCYCGSEEHCRKRYEANPTPLNARYWQYKLRYEKKDCEAAERLQEKADRNIGWSSELLAPSGTAILQNGNRQAPTAAALSASNSRKHRHYDQLNLEIIAENVSMIPDFGYPDSASADDPVRSGFRSNTLTHNTVVVDETRQAMGEGHFLRFDAGEFLQCFSAKSEKVYENVSRYERTVLACEAAPGQTVYLDSFIVEGGSKHDWFIHGSGENFESDISFGNAQPGTLAGPDVEYGTFYDDPALEAMKDALYRNYMTYTGSGYQYLTKVRYGSCQAAQSIAFPAENRAQFEPNPGAAIKIYFLDQEDELALGEGPVPLTIPYPQSHLLFLTRRRRGAAPLFSNFHTVYETYADASKNRAIKTLERLPVPGNAAAVKMSFADGRTLYMFLAEKTVAFAVDGVVFSGGGGALLLHADGTVSKAGLLGSGFIKKQDRLLLEGQDPFRSEIKAVDLFAETITLKDAVPECWTGKFFRAGRYGSARALSIENHTVKMLEQSPICGRFRVIERVAEDSLRGKIFPVPGLAKPGMSLYRDGERPEYIGRIEKLDAEPGILFASGKLEVDQEYWVSWFGPGESLEFPGFAAQEF